MRLTGVKFEIVLAAVLVLAGARWTCAEVGGNPDDSSTKAIGVEQAVAALPAEVRTPNRYALIIGASAYADDRIPDLAACANDARALQKVLTDPGIGMFPREHVTLLLDDQVTQPKVKDALDQLARRAGPQDLVLIFFSGHGATDERGRAYWVMADTEIDKLRATALPETDVSELLGEIRTTRLVTLIDACYSAATAKLEQTKSLLDLQAIFPRFQGEGRVAITASKGDQLSVVIKDEQDPGRGYSAFAWHVIGGLKGSAGADEDGVLTVDELWNYVKDRTEQTARRQGGNQQPQLKGQIGSRFLLAVNADTLTARTAATRRQVDALRKLLAESNITGQQFDLGRTLLESADARLDDAARQRRKLFVDLAEGRLAPGYLQPLLDKVAPIQPATTQPAQPRPPAERAGADAGYVETLRQTYLDGKLPVEMFRLGESLLTADPGKLSRYDRDRRAEFVNVAERRLKPEQLERALALLETPQQEAQRLQNQKIAQLLATAKANDNDEQGRTAQAALDELFKLDPDHAEAKALQTKIAAYFPPTKVGDTWTNSIGMKFAYIPAGEFMMGSPANEEGRDDVDETQHQVRITKPFLMGVTEVTQAQWRAVMGTTVAQQRDNVNRSWPLRGEGDAYPMYYVSWHEAVEFCRRLSEKEGKRYRLPTEAEWEYACRAGTTGPYGGTGRLDDMGWHAYENGEQTKSVGQKQQNAWGQYDMHGNVWEWCSDWYGGYPAGNVTDPTGPVNGASRVLRGGSWNYNWRRCRSATRHRYAPDIRFDNVGVRLVLDF